MPANGCGRSRESAGGSGQIWKWTTLGIVAFPVSLWNGVRVSQVGQTPFPFQQAFGSSKGPGKLVVSKAGEAYDARV
jgi:hypothetical protein